MQKNIENNARNIDYFIKVLTNGNYDSVFN